MRLKDLNTYFLYKRGEAPCATASVIWMSNFLDACGDTIGEKLCA